VDPRGPILLLVFAVAACNAADFKSTTAKGNSDQAGDDECFDDCRDPAVAPSDAGPEADGDASNGHDGAAE
jgi:hypothetical protein